ncbi:HDOD domain-containing protein [Pelagicoccus sp. SDUM812002]|uniref:HDOD domain-containing protein n=1 Tax=Pelagicoccus sp. SDUM812002 TaxID=3041266 RepID=UPI00280E1F33|nr:HDOD domain-containing protein [Pelagicoccus sp. SDUM812002]MDQ8185735.1 HDOD domain-containing protein [Pelagicoccus sp. SDUM812002]
MANVLLVDPDEVARMAMGGIVARGGNRFAAVDSVAAAWKFIRRNVKVDIVFIELKLKGENGLALVQDLKADCLLRTIPLVVYTAHPDRDSVKKVLELRVQNFLVKPYREELVFAEISKARSEPWLEHYFEAGNPEWEPERLNAMLEKLSGALNEGQDSLAKRKAVEGKAQKPIVDWLKKLSAVADKTGAEGVVYCLDDLALRASAGKWPTGDENNDPLGLASRLIEAYLNPDTVPEDFMSEEEMKSDEEARERGYWETAFVEERCPLIGIDQIKREFDKITSCPIVESIAASFQMAANGRPTSLAPLLDLVHRDPSLSAEIFIAANRLKKDKEDKTFAIESTRMAVGLLGEMRLASLGLNFETVAERFFESGPHMDWPAFRMFQVATGRMAEFVCEYLEMPNLAPIAYTAGLMQDLGKMLLTRLHPFALPVIKDHAAQTGVALASAERLFLGCTTHDIALAYAEKQGLPSRFQSVFRWVNNPEAALKDEDLVAAVSLARELCRRKRVGCNGDTTFDETESLESTPEWKVLSKRVYLNFDMSKFERMAYAECLALKRELAGKLPKRSVA